MSSTSSAQPELLGEQKPRLCRAPPAVTSAGTEAVRLAASAGLILDPWQVLALEVMLAERADGRWAAFEVGILVARQNGKGSILEARALAGLFLFAEQTIVWSAHEFKTAKEGYKRLKALISATPALKAKVAHRANAPMGPKGCATCLAGTKCLQVTGFHQSNEDTSITLANGQRVVYLARSKGSGRGWTGDCNIFDEAQELPAAAIDAMMPTLSAMSITGNPQVIYTGTVPGPTNDDEHWTKIRDRGRAGDDPALAWLEWTPQPKPGKDLVDIDLDDPIARGQANPARGIRISAEFIEHERRSMSEAGFARERMSIWGGLHRRTVIDMALWAELHDATSAVADPVGMVIDVAPDRSSSSIGCAGRNAEGLWHVELIHTAPGTAWVVDVAVELDQHWEPTWMVDETGPVSSLSPDLEAAGLTIARATARDMGRACGLFYDAVTQRQLRHLNQVPLATALGVATKRKLGDLWAWQRADGLTNISPLVAVTLAMRAHQLPPPAPPKKKSGRLRTGRR